MPLLSWIAVPPTLDNGLIILNLQGTVLHRVTAFQGQKIDKGNVNWMPDNPVVFSISKKFAAPIGNLPRHQSLKNFPLRNGMTYPLVLMAPEWPLLPIIISGWWMPMVAIWFRWPPAIRWKQYQNFRRMGNGWCWDLITVQQVLSAIYDTSSLFPPMANNIMQIKALIKCYPPDPQRKNGTRSFQRGTCLALKKFTGNFHGTPIPW